MIVLRNKVFSFPRRLKSILVGAGLGALILQPFAIVGGTIAGLNKFLNGKGGPGKVWGGITLSGILLGAVLGNKLYKTEKELEKRDKWVESHKEEIKELISKNTPRNLKDITSFCEAVSKLDKKYLDDTFWEENYELPYVTFYCCSNEKGLINTTGKLLYELDRKSPNLEISKQESIPIMYSEYWTEISEGGSTLMYSSRFGYKDDKGRLFRGPKDYVISSINEYEKLIGKDHKNIELWPKYKEELIKIANRYLH